MSYLGHWTCCKDYITKDISAVRAVILFNCVGFVVKMTFQSLFTSADFHKHVYICLLQCLDPGSPSDRPHPPHCGEVASPTGRRSHSRRALATSHHFCRHGSRHPRIYERDVVRHQVGGYACGLLVINICHNVIDVHITLRS